MSARVIVLAGPSGSGKSRLARRLHERHSWPVLQLDDFYREATDTGLPMSPLGLADWDDVRSWDLTAALESMTQLCREGSTELPVYDISTSSVVGRQVVRLGAHPFVVAEGIFAAHTVQGLRERDLLATAVCVRNRPWVTFSRRLVRDLAERRKPPATLWRRGHLLRRAEPRIVAGHQALGTDPMTAREAERQIHQLVAGVGRPGRAASHSRSHPDDRPEGRGSDG